MTFSDEQKAALTANLDTKHVRSREQSGRKLSYIEGWWAIAEANRIFGFENWDRSTYDLTCLHPPVENQNGNTVVSYSAKVRITVRHDGGEVQRVGCGYGSGISKNIGDAHESAIKEAETDAMKRALMTFGNPFGLALYDKKQENVGAPKEPAIDAAQKEEVIALLRKHGVPTGVFLKKGEISSVDELKAHNFANACQWIRKHPIPDDSPFKEEAA